MRTYTVTYSVKLNLTQADVNKLLAYERIDNEDADAITTNPDDIADALYDYVDDLLGTGTLIDEQVDVRADPASVVALCHPPQVDSCAACRVMID